MNKIRELRSELPGPVTLTPAKPARTGQAEVTTPQQRGPAQPFVTAQGGVTPSHRGASQLLQLQKTQGNRAVGRIISTSRGFGGKAAVTRPPRTSGPIASPGERRSKGTPLQKGRPETSTDSATSHTERQLLNATADAQRALAAIPDLALPQPKSPGSKLILDTLRDAAKQGRDTLIAASAAVIQSTTSSTQAHVEALTRSESATVEKIRGQIQSSHEQVSEALIEHANSVRTAQDEEQQKLRAWHAQTSSRAHEEVSKRQESVTAMGAEHAAKIQEAGANSAKVSGATLDSASTEARSHDQSGGDDRTAGRAEVASRLGNDASSQMNSARSENQSQLETHAHDAAQSVNTHANQAAAALADASPMLQTQLGQTVASAASEINRAEDRSIATLHTGAEQSHEQLNVVESRAVQATATAAGKRREQLHSAGAEAVTGIRNQAQKAIGVAQQQINAQANHIATAKVDEKTATSVAGNLQAQITKAYSSSAEQVYGFESQLGAPLTAAAQDGANTLSRMPTQTATGLASASRAVASEMTRISKATEASIRRGINTTMARSDDAVSKSASHLDQAVAQAKSGFAGAAAAVTRSLDGAVSDVARKTADALSGLRGRIAEGQSRVDGFVAQQGLPIYRSILGDIGDWIAGQFRDLWDMLSSPSFWVGLVVTIVLFPVMGPAALIVGGAAGGAVSGIEQNIKQGKHWYDWHNIVRNAAIGAAAGAAMAVGLLVIEAAGLEGLAATAALMGLSAAIGIVVNLVNGQRWDKGLLANLFLAWLFERIGGGREAAPEEGEIPQPPEARPSETAPQGMSLTLQGLRAGLHDPRAIAQFDAIFERLGGNSAKMEQIVSRFPNLEERMISDWEAANPTPRGAALAEVAPLKARAEALRAEMEAFRTANPQIARIAGRLKALQGEITRLDGMLQGRIEATPEAVEGTRNNINGIEAEFRSAQNARNVTQLGGKFSLDGVPDKVEVDVVADNGATWIDTKNVSPFGLESSDWVGGPGKQGLKTQAEEMVRSAKQNPLPSGETPRVVLEFPQGLSPEVADALRALGAEPQGKIVRPFPKAVVPVGKPDDDQKKNQ